MLRRLVRSLRARYRRRVMNVKGAWFWPLYRLYLQSLPKAPTAWPENDLIGFANEGEIVLCERSRLFWYERSVRGRLEMLAREYKLETIDVRDGDTVIDCGANIGEIGKYFQQRAVEIDYVAIEPADRESRACRRNNPRGRILQVGLWDHCGSKTFYLKGDTADSSLFEVAAYTEAVTIDVLTLEAVFERLGLTACRLLKVEAEGAEPEVLRGAAGVLSHIEYVVVDAGPERGPDQRPTIMDVVPFMLQHGFAFLDFSPARTACVFKNQDFRPISAA